jgi:hypothetical protein
MVLHSGFIERRRTKERDPAVVVFDQYAFDLTRITPARTHPIGSRPTD